MSAVLLMTTSWPIAVIGILPACVSSTVIFGHDAETVAVFRSNCILSSPASLNVQCCAAWADGAVPTNIASARNAEVGFMANVSPWKWTDVEGTRTQRIASLGASMAGILQNRAGGGPDRDQSRVRRVPR